MTVATLDNYFPFLVFGYGFVITAVLNSPLVELAETRLPARTAAQLKAHRGLALLCLGLGFFWSMQNLWLAT